MKIILVDSHILMFKAIYASLEHKEVSVTWQYLNMLISNLRRLFLTKEDIVIIAVDSSLGSWRREIDSEYKANRKEQRELVVEIDWDYMFEKFNSFLKLLNKATPFHIISIPKLEADDIIAYSPNYFKDNEIIIVSSDTDFEMLTSYSNVKIFSPISKNFKEVKNPYQILNNKIAQEKTDNLLSPILSEQDYEKRKKIVDLIHLPEEVKKKVEVAFSELNIKDYNINLIPFFSLRKRFEEIYTNPIEIKEKKKRKRKLKQATLI